jgi:hypothetical protein
MNSDNFDLTPQVAPNYLVAIEERVYQSVEDALLVGIADVSLTRRPTLNPNELTQKSIQQCSNKTGARQGSQRNHFESP